MTIFDLAKSCLNIPYFWGGKNPLTGFDCSGLVEWILSPFGMDPPGTVNAQALHDWFMLEDRSLGMFIGPGTLCFYGKSDKEITHVAMIMDNNMLIEAGGGDHTTINLDEAKKRGACVRMRKIGHRSDLVATLLPKYPTGAV